MAHGASRATTAVFLLALSACGGRALLDEGAAGPATGGQSGTFGTGGSFGGAAATTPQGGGPVLTSGGSSATPVCKELCEAILCTGGNAITPPGQCCPVCAPTTPPASDAGPPLVSDAGPPAPTQCPGLEPNPPLSCPFTLADVACNSDSDCTTRMFPLCSDCSGLLYGVNRASTRMCGPTACSPIGTNCSTYSLQTQDCLVSPKGRDIIGAKCVAGQCKSVDQGPMLLK